MTLKRDPKCTRCGLHETAQFVCLLGKGQIPSKAMIVGEAPGHREDDSGKPFVGQAGQLLRNILEIHGLTDSKLFITNSVSCRPPENRTPSKKEIKACSYWLQKQIEEVKPKYFLLLGNVALQAVLGLKGIKKLRGKPIEKDGCIYLPAYHPAYILRDPTQRPALEADIRLFSEIVASNGLPEPEGLNSRVVMTWDDVRDLLDDLKGTVSFDIETNSLYPWESTAKILSIGFGTKTTQWIVPMKHKASPWRLGDQKRIIAKIDKRLKDCMIVAHNGKFDATWVKVHYDVYWDIDFDTMLAHYLLDENSRHGLKYLAQVYFGVMDWEVSVNNATWDELVEYQSKDLLYTRKLRFLFGKMLNKEGNVKDVFEKILMPCSRLFTRAEVRGVYIDVPKMQEVEAYLLNEVKESKKDLDKYAPGINWRSVPQLSKVLYHDLKLDVLERTKKGAPSTAESVLKRLDHPITKALLRFRAANQQLSFFIEGWKPFLVNNRIHPSFKLHGTVTGRLSCEHPNLQQVPRDPKIRSLITAPPNWVLVEADLSQIELRIVAELANEQHMLQAFADKQDIHWLTAIREISRNGDMAELIIHTASNAQGQKVSYSKAVEILLNVGADKSVEIDSRWKELRKKAKAVNFGYVYGMWWKKFMIYARDNYGVVVSEKQARLSRDTFFQLYPGLEAWHERQRNYARQFGYVRSLSGRKRRLPAAQSPLDTPERGEALRQAINAPVQSFANELNLMAALQLSQEFDSDTINIVGTVHDSILVEVRKTEVKRVVERLQEIMRHPKLLDDLGIKLKVPIDAEAKVGAWGTGKELKKWLSST